MSSVCKCENYSHFQQKYKCITIDIVSFEQMSLTDDSHNPLGCGQFGPRRLIGRIYVGVCVGGGGGSGGGALNKAACLISEEKSFKGMYGRTEGRRTGKDHNSSS